MTLLFNIKCKVCYGVIVIRVPNLDKPIVSLRCPNCGVVGVYDLRKYPYINV